MLVGCVEYAECTSVSRIKKTEKKKMALNCI